jgi:XTP/dITP diphosphohydrolase
VTTLLLATTNAGKLREIRDVLAGLAVEVRALADGPSIPEPEETGRTFEENAREKALYYSAATGSLVVAEDSGLEIDALDRAPGVYSARFGGDVLFEARGTIEGRITSPPRGSGGFGYDPIFLYPPFNCTLAEVEAERKSSVSHRGQAFRRLRRYLEGSGLPALRSGRDTGAKR